MKQREFKNCAICRNGMMKDGIPLFYRVKVQRFAINVQAVQRQAGLEQYFAGAPALAAIMGPDEDLAQPIDDEAEVFICQTCALSEAVLVGILPEVGRNG